MIKIVSIDIPSQGPYNRGMKLLLTNDDGIFAPGLRAFYRGLIPWADVTVVAPMGCRSGTSHSITYTEPVTCHQVTVEDEFTGYGVLGSPADCVKLACMQLADDPFDLVVSGINHGANVGLNILYSGTVAAALEGAIMGLPAVALSLASGETMDFNRAAELGIPLLKACLPMQPGEVVNINVPRLAPGNPLGIRVTEQSTSGFHEYYHARKDGHHQTVYQLGADHHRQENPPKDTSLVSEGYITITPLRLDLTDHSQLDRLHQRFNNNAPSS